MACICNHESRCFVFFKTFTHFEFTFHRRFPQPLPANIFNTSHAKSTYFFIFFFFFCKTLKENFFVLFIYEWINEKFPESIFRTIEKHRLVIRPIDFAPSSNYGLEGNHTGYEDKSVNNITWSIYSINY